MLLSISEILAKASAEPTNEKKKELLQKFGKKNQALIRILQMAYDERIVFNLPKGDPPYKPNEYPDQQANLYNELRRFYLFIGDGNPKITKLKKESLFIQLLETVDPEDAKLILALKNKHLPQAYKSLTRKLVSEAFPGLLPDPPAKAPAKLKVDSKPAEPPKVEAPK